MSELPLSGDQTRTAERYDVPGEETPAWVAFAIALSGTLAAVSAAALFVDPALETWFMSRQGADIVERHDSRWVPATSETDHEGSVTEVEARKTLSKAPPTAGAEGGDPFGATAPTPEKDSAASELIGRAGNKRPAPVQIAVTSSTTPAREASELPADTAESSDVQQAPAVASVSVVADVEPAKAATGGQSDKNRFRETRRSAVQADDCAPLFLVTFARGGAKPAARDLQAKIAKLSVWLETHPQVRLQLDGHTDKLGPDEINMLLSYRRAKAVAALLTDAGVPSGQLTLGAYGENLPTEGLPPDSAQNRRVSMHVEGVPKCTDAMTEGKTR